MIRTSILGIWSNKNTNSRFKITDSRLLINKQSSIFNLQSLMKNKGFTLLELSLVILVIGMVLALVLPNVGIPKARLEREREIEKLSQTIKYLYNLAQVRNEEIIVLFNLDKNEFSAISSHEEENILPERKIGSYLKIQDIIDTKGNKSTEGIVPLVFHPSGFVEPATIHFLDKKEKFYTLFINPLTGQSIIENGYLIKE